MAKPRLTVYLDHLISRDNLFYKRPTTAGIEHPRRDDFLNIKQLYGEDSEAYLLKKPDFQRATWSWTPEDCVDLLYAVLNEQVVPSVIMWLSEDGTKFILDGGHRISVLLAWIKDDWGDRLPAGSFKDDSLERASKEAALKVRDALKDIGTFDEYIRAEKRYRELDEQGKKSSAEIIAAMDSVSYDYAMKARRWKSVAVGFPVLWVKGDYKTAEQSFLKINKTGRQLSKWETKLVENRTSSMARAVMSIAEFQQASRFWPLNDEEVRGSKNLSEKAETIIQIVNELHELLFLPIYETPIKQPVQPLVATPFTKPETKPAIVAEILTITEGLKGRLTETERLIQKDNGAPPYVLIPNGLNLLKHAKDDVLSVYGNNPRSLLLMPLVYFYSDQGRYVRSLLYGMLYWINYGSPTKDVFNRKILFSVHRQAFEQILIEHKEEIIRRITRRIGSGSEVTYQTASYFHGLLKLFIKHNDQIESDEFKSDHKDLIENLGKPNGKAFPQKQESVSRTFTQTQKTTANVKDFLTLFPKCEICGGRYYPGLFTQADHIEERRKGGKTTVPNLRNTHPFCNNNRAKIEDGLSSKLTLELPAFNDSEQPAQQLVLNFFDEVEKMTEDPSISLDEEDEEISDSDEETD